MLNETLNLKIQWRKKDQEHLLKTLTNNPIRKSHLLHFQKHFYCADDNIQSQASLGKEKDAENYAQRHVSMPITESFGQNVSVLWRTCLMETWWARGRGDNAADVRGWDTWIDGSPFTFSVSSDSTALRFCGHWNETWRHSHDQKRRMFSLRHWLCHWNEGSFS